MLNAILSPSAAALLNWLLRKDPVNHWGILCFKILFSAWLSCKLIWLSLPSLAPFLFSQGLCFLGDWALHSFLSLLIYSTWAADVSSLCARVVLVPLYRFDRCGSISGSEFYKHTCGQDHLLWMTSTFLQLTVSGIIGLFWIHCVGGMVIPHSKYCFDKYFPNTWKRGVYSQVGGSARL